MHESSSDLDVRIGAIRLQHKKPTYKAYCVTLDSIDDIATLLGATDVDIVTRKEDGEAREYRVHFTTPEMKYSLRVSTGFGDGDYLVTSEDGSEPFWDIKSAQEIARSFTRVG